MRKHKLYARALYAVMALALVVGLTLVPAVGADSPADTDVGFELGAGPDNDTAEWSDAKKAETDAMGDYSVELYQAGDAVGTHGGTYVQLIPPSGITFADFETDIANAGDEWSFWNWNLNADGSGHQPQFELKFTAPADSTEYVDIMFVQHGLVEDAAWEKVTVDKDVVSFLYWGPNIGSATSGPEYCQNFADLLAAASSEGKVLGDGDYDDYLLTRVQVQLYEATPARTCYIDDITIDGTTYELEPIFLDAEYYSVGDTVEVTVPNFNVNTDSIRVNPVTDEIPEEDWQVTVTSTSETTDITVDLKETGANTGVFTCSIGTTGTTPVGEDELYVQDGDTITITYDPTSNWGTGGLLATILTPKVDDTPPTITSVLPLDGDQIVDATPEIKATYVDTVADIDKTSVEMFLDGVDVTDDAAPGVSAVTYTPEDDLADGIHKVTVNVSDKAGNAATKTWSFRIVSWLVEPMNGEDEDALDTVGVAVFDVDTGDATIMVGRYASNPEPEAPPTFAMIENGFFDVKVTDAGTATQIVLIFADDNITAESTAYVWGELEGEWLECSNQDYSVANEWLWVKVRTDTIPNIADLTGTPFAISGEAPPPPPGKGDFNGDNKIDLIDFVYFAEAYDSVSTDPNYNVIGDFDDDGDIDLIDFVQFASVYGTSW